MSRIGKIPIQVPPDVKLSLDKGAVTVEGSRGKLTQVCGSAVEISVENGTCVVTRKADSKEARAAHGLYRKLIHNMVVGVSRGFTKVLVVNGVGYRAELKDNVLVFNLGFSNPIEYPVPPGISASVEANNRITLTGADRQQLGQVCAEIRKMRPPEPYKGKGIRYENEHVRRKVGKTGVK